jgi:hypothetical protein
LPCRQFLVQPQNASIAAHQQRLRDVLRGRSSGGNPRYLHGHAETHTVALTEPVACYRFVCHEEDFHFRLAPSSPACFFVSLHFVVPTNSSCCSRQLPGAPRDVASFALLSITIPPFLAFSGSLNR